MIKGKVFYYENLIWSIVNTGVQTDYWRHLFQLPGLPCTMDSFEPNHGLTKISLVCWRGKIL